MLGVLCEDVIGVEFVGFVAVSLVYSLLGVAPGLWLQIAGSLDLGSCLVKRIQLVPSTEFDRQV